MSNLTFGVASVESKDFVEDLTYDGLLGTAKSSIANQSVPTPVEMLAQQGLISEAITSYKISRLSDGLNDGEITFGGLDSSKFDSSTLVTFQDVSKGGFWEGATTISVGGQSILQNRTAILDTGTTLIMAPPADAEAIHAKIPGSKKAKDDDGEDTYVIPCTNNVTVSLTFCGRAFDINPIDLLFAPVDEKNLKGECYSAITPGNFVGPQQWL